MRKDTKDISELKLLKKEFTNALEIGDMKRANETLNSIDTAFHNISGKSFRDTLSKEERLKIDNFMKGGNII
jgi:ABC-type transporter Mla subunit MlaD